MTYTTIDEYVGVAPSSLSPQRAEWDHGSCKARPWKVAPHMIENPFSDTARPHFHSVPDVITGNQ